MSMPTNVFKFGRQTITTRVNVMVPRNGTPRPVIDVTDAMDERPRPRTVALPVAGADARPAGMPTTAEFDPFGAVEV